MSKFSQVDITFNEDDDELNAIRDGNNNPVEAGNPPAHSMRETLSQAMLNSNLYQSLPKYIFQSEHEPLQLIKDLYEESKQQQNKGIEMDNGDCELSEYPIEFIEQQQHALQRQMSIK